MQPTSAHIAHRGRGVRVHEATHEDLVCRAFITYAEFDINVFLVQMGSREKSYAPGAYR
jgi:hypothetical protein